MSNSNNGHPAPPRNATLIDRFTLAQPALGGWLIALAIALVALPVWLVIQLQSFLAEWGRMVDYLATWDIWSGGDANGSGLVLVPLAGALTPPMFELAAAVSMFAGSAVLLALLLLRLEPARAADLEAITSPPPFPG